MQTDIKSRRCKRLNADTIARCSRMTTNANRDCGLHRDLTASAGTPLPPTDAVLKAAAKAETAYLRRGSYVPDENTIQARLEEFDTLIDAATEGFVVCTTQGSTEEPSLELVRSETHVDLLRYPQDRLKWGDAWKHAARIRARENRTRLIDLVVVEASKDLLMALAEIDFHYGLQYGGVRKYIETPITADG